MKTFLDLRGNIPTFIHISDGKMRDINVLDIMPIEAEAFCVMDRGYLDFARPYGIHQTGAFFVTRAKRGIHAHRLYFAPNDGDDGVICDQTIAWNGFYPPRPTPSICDESGSTARSCKRRWYF
jgi:hypothetical protein